MTASSPGAAPERTLWRLRLGSGVEKSPAERGASDGARFPAGACGAGMASMHHASCRHVTVMPRSAAAVCYRARS
jgi:hypothetical protein